MENLISKDSLPNTHAVLISKKGQLIYEKYQTQKDSLKARIDIHSLLTMSSGLDAIDYGINANPKSPAVEDNYQPSEDWTASVLKASMINLQNPNLKNLAVFTNKHEPF